VINTSIKVITKGQVGYARRKIIHRLIEEPTKD